MVSLATLVVATIIRSRLWLFASAFTILGGLVEVMLVIVIAPVFCVAWGILWKGKIVSEPVVVFLTPYSLLLLMLGTTYTAWILATSCLVIGVWMMRFKLPMVPYNVDSVDHYR